MTTVKKELTFNDFCYKIMDGMYEPRLPMESQCTGYRLLREMVINNITPATKEEFNRWKTNPTKEELFSEPDLKYLTFLHELARPIVREHWDKIKEMKVD